MKRWLFLAHRWLGVALCLFMAMWFVTGVVMLYVGYPKLSDAERLARLPPLATVAGDTDASAWRPPVAAQPPASLRLTSIAGRAHFVATFGRDRVVAVDAADGRPVARVDDAGALAAAAAFAGGAPVVHEGVVAEDAWTHSRALDAHRPLHRVRVGDADDTWLYVSSRTGEVVRDATGAERAWNLVGAWLHWLYPLRGGALDAAWHDVVVWTSVVATLLALAGLAVGVLRWRFAGRYRSGARTPYRERWMRWHHVSGLLFGVLAVTWIFSGLMSMNPWKVFGAGARLDERAWAGAAIDPARAPADAARALARLEAAGFTARELAWRNVGGLRFVAALDGAGGTRIVPLDDDGVLAALPQRLVEQAGRRLVPGAALVAVDRLDAYDLYYYARASHTMLGHVERRLPVLRLRFDDPGETWVHIDPATGALLGRLDTRQRVKRWLFAMLHSWDWAPLLSRRPAWDAWMLAGSAGGIVLCVSGVVVGWRRLRRFRAMIAVPPSTTRQST